MNESTQDPSNRDPQPLEDGSRKPPAEAKLQLENQKLELEVAKLKREATRLGRAAAVVLPVSVSAVTAFVAILSIGLSAWTLYNQRRFQEMDSHDKELQVALDMATDGKGQVDRRVSGIYQLRRFWTNPGDEGIVAGTLAAILVLPDLNLDTSSVRCAAAEVIGSAYAMGGDGPDKEARKHRIARLLYGGADGSLGLVSRENYLLRRSRDADPHAADLRKDDSLAITVACRTPLGATREAIRKSWEFLREVNLQYTDLSFAELYAADLAHSTLKGAYLRRADLRCANLAGSDLERIPLKFDAGDEPDLHYANVGGAKSESDGFVKYAIAHHAIQLTDSDWKAWEGSGFDGNGLKRLMGARLPSWAESEISGIASICNEMSESRGWSNP